MALPVIPQFVATTLTTVGALLPIVDPLGGAPIYLAVIAGLPAADRSSMAKRVAINSFLLLVASIIGGAYVLRFFGVSIPAVQIAGGIVLCAIAWSLLHSPLTPAVSDRPRAGTEATAQHAFYPLTMPLTVGPGSISAALTLGVNAPGDLGMRFAIAMAHVCGAVLVALVIYLCYRYAERILRRLGSTGTSVLIRLTAFILLCIGVQIAANGARAMFAIAART